MYAIVRQRDGSYYTSVVFGYFFHVTTNDDYKRYLACNQRYFYIVLNREKTGLIARLQFEPENEYLDPLIIVTDHSQDDWITDGSIYGYGCVNFLDPESLLRDVTEGKVSSADTKKCIDMDREYVYSEYVCVDSESRLDDLWRATVDFSDSYLKEVKKLSEDEIYVFFEGFFGCSTELWFKGETDYNIDPKILGVRTAYWDDPTLDFFDGIYYLSIYPGASPDKHYENETWFKGKELKYRIIPNSKYKFSHR
ncbi:MAG: hypothetical protein K2N72_13200 [Oscillospiraceae bacterium]|nr:hypothetical protein [Oscillospiraceae bacterium]